MARKFNPDQGQTIVLFYQSDDCSRFGKGALASAMRMKMTWPVSVFVIKLIQSDVYTEIAHMSIVRAVYYAKNICDVPKWHEC